MDGTILGMGRGAGNVSTEALLTEINKGKVNNKLKRVLFQKIRQKTRRKNYNKVPR